MVLWVCEEQVWEFTGRTTEETCQPFPIKTQFCRVVLFVCVNAIALWLTPRAFANKLLLRHLSTANKSGVLCVCDDMTCMVDYTFNFPKKSNYRSIVPRKTWHTSDKTFSTGRFCFCLPICPLSLSAEFPVRTSTHSPVVCYSISFFGKTRQRRTTHVFT